MLRFRVKFDVLLSAGLGLLTKARVVTAVDHTASRAASMDTLGNQVDNQPLWQGARMTSDVVHQDDISGPTQEGGGMSPSLPASVSTC